MLNFIKLKAVLIMIGVMMLICFVLIGLAYAACHGEYSDHARIPWEKEEQKAEKMRQKALTKKQWYEN